MARVCTNIVQILRPFTTAREQLDCLDNSSQVLYTAPGVWCRDSSGTDELSCILWLHEVWLHIAA